MAEILHLHVTSYNLMERKDKFSTKYLYKILKILNAEIIVKEK